MDKFIIVIGGGILQVPTVEIAHSMGLKVCIMDKSKDAPALKIADDYRLVSTKDIEEAIKQAKLFAENHNVVGVYTQGCDVELTVAKVAEALNLPHINIDSANDCNNKIKMRERLAKHNVSGPKFAWADSYDDALLKAAQIGYPLVVKSIDNSASRGITIIDNEKKLEAACKEAQKYSFYDKRILLEEYLEGEEYSVDTIVYDGILYPCGISDREFDFSHEYAVQTGSVTPSRLSEDIQEKMYKLMDNAAKAMGITKGAFKGDLILCNNEPKVIEITARLSGGFDSQYRKPYSFGINLIKATIDIAIGNKLDFRDIIPRWVKYSKTVCPFPKPGKIIAISGLDELRKMKGVRNIILNVKVGDIIEDYKHCANRVGYIIISSDSYEDMKELEKQVLDTLDIHTEEINV